MHTDIERLIVTASKGETVTERQREIIRNKAISLGEDPEEAELLLDLSFKRKKNRSLIEGIDSGIQEKVDFSQKHPETQEEKSTSIKERRNSKIIYGVCAKLARHFNIDVRIIRLIIVVIEVVLVFLSFLFFSFSWSLLLPLIYFIMGKVSPVLHN